MNADLKAIAKILKILEPLTSAERRRILDYLTQWEEDQRVPFQTITSPWTVYPQYPQTQITPTTDDPWRFTGSTDGTGFVETPENNTIITSER